MISMFLLSMFVNLFIKVVVWLIKQNLAGNQIPDKHKAKISEALWLTNKLHLEAGRAGIGLSGTQPAEWTEEEVVINNRLVAFGLNRSDFSDN